MRPLTFTSSTFQSTVSIKGGRSSRVSAIHQRQSDGNHHIGRHLAVMEGGKVSLGEVWRGAGGVGFESVIIQETGKEEAQTETVEDKELSPSSTSLFAPGPPHLPSQAQHGTLTSCQSGATTESRKSKNK